jgi:uncharacterized protein involved in type VI secretion and phage assembly
VTPFDLLFEPTEPGAGAARIYGVVVGIVTSNSQDPEDLGRIKVRFPWLSDQDESAWARVATPMAGKERGCYFLPEVNDEVLVAFEHGDPRFPCVLGALWNGQDTPPAKNDDGHNNVRLIKSRSGHVVRLVDEAGKEKIEIVDKTGKNSIVFDAQANTVTITADKDIVLSAAQGTIKLDAQKIELKSAADAKVEAGADLKLKGATVNIN